MTFRYLKHLAPWAALLACFPAYVLADDSQLDTIVITASRTEMPLERVGASLTVITEEQIRESGQTSLADLLRTTVGITATNSGGSGAASVIRIRGEEGFRTKVLVDGIDMADPAGVQILTLIEHIPIAEIERIEVLRGPQGMMYGADAGGVVNIITKHAGKDLAGSFQAETGRYNSQLASGNIRGSQGIFDYSLSVSDQETDGFNSTKADNILKDDDGYDNTTAHGRFGVNITEKTRAQLSLRQTDARHEFDICFDPFFTPTNLCTDDYLQQAARIDLTHRDDVVRHEFSHGITSMDHDFYANGVKNFYTEGETEQTQYTAHVRIGTAGQFLLGLDEREDRITDDGSGADFERDQTGVYSEWQGGIGKQFFYTVGLRHDDNDDFGGHTTYRTTAAWLQTLGNDTLKYKASYGTGFRAPSLFEIAYNNGPFAFPPASLTTLDEEISSGYDIGIEFHGASGLFLEAVYFSQQVEDAIYFDLAGFSGYLQENGTTDSTGIELSAEGPVTGPLSFFSNYTYNDTETSTGDQRVRRPLHSGNVGLKGKHSQWNWMTAVRFANDAEDEVAGTRVDLDDYQVLDATVSYTGFRSLELYVRGQNLLDNDYEEVIGFNTAGTAFTLGFRAQLP